MPAEFVTFGCRLNTYESEVMRGHAAAAMLDDAVVFNTCAVTAEATRQARQAIRRARKERPDATIVVTGCAAQIDAPMFAAMPEVDLVLGNAEKMQPERWSPSDDRVRVGDIMTAPAAIPRMIDGLTERTRAFVQVQNGCDHRCTFCVIPLGRGNSRSTPIADVVAQVRRFIGNGIAEVVLTGVDITSWGADLEGQPKLGRLLAAVLREAPALQRLRLSSIDSVEADPELLELVAGEPRVMPHLHLSLQAGDDMILKRMKRRHGRDDAIAFCAALRAKRPDIVFGADIIAGFPTETEAMFDNSLRLVEACGLTYLHVFPFSPRPGTPAARMPQVAKPVAADRARQLREAGARRLADFLHAEVGATRDVLVETPRSGRTQHFAPVNFSADMTPGSVVTAHITAATSRYLEAGVCV